jgi:hypothetical protein
VFAVAGSGAEPDMADLERKEDVDLETADGSNYRVTDDPGDTPADGSNYRDHDADESEVGTARTTG